MMCGGIDAMMRGGIVSMILLSPLALNHNRMVHGGTAKIPRHAKYGRGLHASTSGQTCVGQGNQKRHSHIGKSATATTGSGLV